MVKDWVNCPVCGESDMPMHNGEITCLNDSCPTNTGELFFKLDPVPESVIDDNEERAKRLVAQDIYAMPIDTYVLFGMIAEIRYHRSKGN